MKRISITSIYFLASFWVFFRSLKYQDQDGTYSLALIGSVSWLICQYSEVKEVKKCSGNRLGILIFLIVSAKGVAVPSAERNHSGLVEIPLANKNGFNLRAPLVRQCFEQKGNSQELDKYCLWNIQHSCSLAFHLLPPSLPTLRRILNDLASWL